MTSRSRPLISIGPVAVQKTYDYIVLGGGSGGCATAGTLAANSKASVALIEAGPPDDSVLVDCPLLAATIVGGLVPLTSFRRYLYPYEGVESKQLAGRRPYTPAGCGLGGSSSINAMLYIRGQPQDYNDWGRFHKGWSYSDVLPVFKRMENNSRGEDDVHGASGGLYVSDPSTALTSHALNNAYYEACVAAGIPKQTDFNAAEGSYGFGHYQTTSRNGRRCNAYDAHIKPLMGVKENLTVMTNTSAVELVFDGTKCTGVKVASRSDAGKIDLTNVIEYKAKEVIVSLGAIQTPALLQRSGIGSRAHLEALGVDRVVSECNGVGQNLTDHLDITVSVKMPQLDRSRSVSSVNLPYMARQWFEWKREHTGKFTNIVEMGGFLKSHENLDRPDIQLHFVDAPILSSGRSPKFWDGCSLHACNLYPHSRGSVFASSRHPGETPHIDFNFLDDPRDLLTMEQCLLWAQLLTDPVVGLKGGYTYGRDGPVHPFGPFYPTPYSPSGQVQARQDKLDWIRGNADTIYHPMGSCAMGRVVDERLRVRGVDGLRIADTSVIPNSLGGNTNAPAQMIGARCGDFLLADG